MTDRNALADKLEKQVERVRLSLIESVDLGYVEDAIEELRQSPSDASPRAPIEPVAWRWRFRGVEANNPWRLVTVDKMSEVACEIEPLYAAPAAPPTLGDMEARKDAAYLERNQVVAALAKCFPSGVARTAIEGWSDDWHGCVYIDLPTGQVSWHFHDSHAYLFEGLPLYAGQWDGHDTPEKYRRLAALTAPDQSGPDYWKVSWREPDKEHQFKILPSKASAFEWAQRISAEHGIIIEHVVEAIEPGDAE